MTRTSLITLIFDLASTAVNLISKASFSLGASATGAASAGAPPPPPAPPPKPNPSGNPRRC